MVADGARAGWTRMAAPPLDFVAREHAAAALLDGKVFIFGGNDGFGMPLDTGAIYDPKLNAWELVAIDPNTPEPRDSAAAVYVSGRVYVWGGKAYDPNTRTYRALDNGAAYDPKLRRWTKIQNGWVDRAGATAATDGTRAIFWGGYNSEAKSLAGGEIYNTAANAWEWMSVSGLPNRTMGETIITSDGAIWVYGGLVDGGGATDSAHRYDMKSNQWTALGPGPSARWGSFGAFDGSHVYLWGGRDENSVYNDGRVFARSWIDLESSNAPVGRWADRNGTGWSAALGMDDVVFFGGHEITGKVLKDGLRYQRASRSWSSVPHWPSDEEHLGAVGIWTGNEFIVFGGRNGAKLSAIGERFRP
jgi:N-acetylneuraminic acid mutarotase